MPTHVDVGIEDGLTFESIVLCEQIQTRCKKEVRGNKPLCHFSDSKMEEINKALAISIGLNVKEVM